MCSKYFDYSKFNNQHKLGGDLYDHLMSTGIFTMILSKIFI
jgi:hypothetical protein